MIAMTHVMIASPDIELSNLIRYNPLFLILDDYIVAISAFKTAMSESFGFVKNCNNSSLVSTPMKTSLRCSQYPIDQSMKHLPD